RGARALSLGGAQDRGDEGRRRARISPAYQLRAGGRPGRLPRARALPGRRAGERRLDAAPPAEETAVFAASGRPAAPPPPRPPLQILTSRKPARRSWSATRALVASSGQEQ